MIQAPSQRRQAYNWVARAVEERSEAALRNTNIFLRAADEVVPYAKRLIYRTEKAHLVRSKSALVVANVLFQINIP